MLQKNVGQMMIKSVIYWLLIVAFLPLLALSGGGEGLVPEQQLSQPQHQPMGGTGPMSAIDHTLHWFEAIPWGLRIFVSLIALVGIYLWRGGSIMIKGIGLSGRKKARDIREAKKRNTD